ncbi:MAG: glycogen debranching enzyme N-terminal domain-containing protein [Prevotellaceae bacterium]|jgi:predicted glycogen debranching enzyme|nr:glycogen debranching enzyme N-terminal domain-containing protein [Prevotellaceae bacterium]
MGYLNFNKNELVNLEYSLSLELLNTNRAGGYTSTTIVGCNTRKYHGWFICPIEEFGGEKHVLLSSLDETVVQHEKAFNLAIHKYPGIYEPRGHKYIVDFEFEPTPSLTYRVGGVILKKELIVVHNEEQILLKYTLLDAHSPTLLRLKPMLAYRSIHTLSKANLYASTQLKFIKHGIASRLYAGYPTLNMQISRNNEFIAVPDWYYNVEYLEEKKRGYEYQEDLFSPGYFEMPIKKGESIIFSASLNEINPLWLNRKFDREMTLRPPKDSFGSCLQNTANQFIMRRKHGVEIVAGYHWYGCRSRDTFISLPGLLWDDPKTYKSVLDCMSATLKNGLFPDIVDAENSLYNSVDTPLWYFWSIQKYESITGETDTIWKSYWKKMKSILEAYRNGSNEGILMHENGLIWAEERGVPKTWMNALVDNVPVTPRYGYTVEVNALWYNAICFALKLAEQYGDKKFVEHWQNIPSLIEDAYMKVFWMPEKNHLADYVGVDGQNQRIRPNEIIATSLPCCPINDEAREDVLKAIEYDLLTPKGIRTLSPKNPAYKGLYEGSVKERDSAFHQGTVWVWLLAHYVEAKFNLHGKSFIPEAKRIMSNFEQDMTAKCICAIPEMYTGDPPHEPCGAISQAWSVAAVLYIAHLIELYEKKSVKKQTVKNSNNRII